MTLAVRLSQALARRCYPCTPLSPKQVAFAIGASPTTLWRWKNDLAAIPAQALIDLDAFFASRGYPGLLSEILDVSRGIPKEVMSNQPNRPSTDSASELEPAGSYKTAPPAVIVAPGARSCTVERLPLDRLSIPAGEHLASVAHAGGDLVGAAYEAGGSVFRVDGGEIVALHLGTSTGMREATRRAFLGKRLDHWPDPAYGELVKGHVLEAIGQPTFYRLDVPVLELRIPYRRAMFPAGDGFVVAISERLAA